MDLAPVTMHKEQTMLDPLTIRQLAQIQCNERVQAAAQARQARGQRAHRHPWRDRMRLMFVEYRVQWGRLLHTSP
jgi:hypothetical protein